MIILIHVLIAITSIVVSSITFMRPTIKKLFVSYGFIFATIFSGTYLVVTTPSHILQSCLTGLVYLTIVSVATVSSHVRLHRPDAAI